MKAARAVTRTAPSSARANERQRWRDPALPGRIGWAIVALLLLWPMLRVAEFNPGLLLAPGNLEVMGNFLSEFFPPSLAPDFLAILGQATLETLAMATAGMALSFLIGVPLAAAVTRSLSVSRIGPGRGQGRALALRQAARFVLMVLRGVPEVVWALVFVRVLGLGPSAGVLAIAITYGGMLGKVYSEILESADRRPARALLEAGSGRIAALCYGLLPATANELASYTVYRWECAVRASVVMGFVGAGGLGQLMDQSLKMLNGSEACSILITFLLLVLLADAISMVLRELLE